MKKRKYIYIHAKVESKKKKKRKEKKKIKNERKKETEEKTNILINENNYVLHNLSFINTTKTEPISPYIPSPPQKKTNENTPYNWKQMAPSSQYGRANHHNGTESRRPVKGRRGNS